MPDWGARKLLTEVREEFKRAPGGLTQAQKGALEKAASLMELASLMCLPVVVRTTVVGQ
ncbi:hypothetical protein FBY35_3904 [Streptomyces sp. SLBN-118]|uniref:hypothetical protein n=1 Tax=Streptomyces sp. SLBN-118 TaxID=2768454 RepID=UPI00116FCFC9|nr:hypothetical protein [Streptomyces sp. SLBN-118]TQK42491.1 hypothetical protein FBY35_3904 [Streptomyces sp. SLBN-118]